MKDFRDLRVWERVHALTLEIYRITLAFPRYELYGLTSQIRRCSVSIGANIAEGCGKRGNNEFQRYLQIASGSASELDYHLLLSRDLGLLSDGDYRNLSKSLSEVRKMLNALLQKVDVDRMMAKC
jgi:four helix bundle protein